MIEQGKCVKARLRASEAVIPHLYLDGSGVVTCGVGHALYSPAAAALLPFFSPSGIPASRAAIQAEYAAVKSMPAGCKPSYYQFRTSLRLSPDSITALLDQDVAGVERALGSEIAGFADFPEAAQGALLDMAFNLGVSGLIRKFPKLMQAVASRNWAACAGECHREEIQDSRNQATVDLFLEAAFGNLQTTF